MHCERKITDDLYYIGASDRRIERFENAYPVPEGVSYNSYVLLDDDVTVFDIADRSVIGQYFQNLETVLDGRPVSYLVIDHVEPDHCATLADFMVRYPETRIVTNVKALNFIKQFFEIDMDDRVLLVKEGDELQTGRHTLAFTMTPMVHWPEVMMTYEKTEKILFSADAFGHFGALSGQIFADEINDSMWDEARRYYSNIVGKYGVQVQMALKKLSGLEIDYVCPLHGLVWRKGFEKYLEKYQQWSLYKPEENGVLIVYGSIYGNTQNAAEVLAKHIVEAGQTNVKVVDVSKTDGSYIISDMFRFSHIVLASATHDAMVFAPMGNLIHLMEHHGVQNRKFAVIENGTWAPMAGKLMEERLLALKGMEKIGEKVTVRSSLKKDGDEQLKDLAMQIVGSF